MTKINKEEYKFLKGLDDKWKWIARDELRNSVYVFYKKPNKYSTYWEDEDMIYEQIDENLFQFIKWEDEEPCSIAELIEEYEYKEFYDYVGWKYAESEEPEVNKDIQWLKREIHKELESWHGVEGGIDGDGINEIMLLINQLDEPEVLSQEWISENVEYAYFDMLDGSGRLSSATAIIKPEKLQNLLVPKQEVSMIPNYVAKWISEHHEKFDLYPALRRLEEGSTRDYDTYKWYRANTLKFVNTYLTGKYEVEKEQKYYLKIGNLYLAEPLGDMTSDIVRMTRDKGVAYQFTDEKSIATHLDKFEGTEAVKVEELEEC